MINILAHKAMMVGYGEGARYITDRYVKLAIQDTESARKHMRLWRARYIKIAAAVLLPLLVAAGVLLWGNPP